MPTVERRYESALGVLEELRHLCVRLALALAAHHPEAKQTLNRLRRDHVNSAFRIGGDDPTVKTVLDELDQLLVRVSHVERSQIAEIEANYRSHRNLGTRALPHGERKSIVLKGVKKD